MKLSLALSFMLVIFSFNVCSAQNKILDVGLIAQGRPPYFSLPTDSEPAKGLYIDILNAIGKDVGIIFRYRFIPQSRIRHLMNHYRLDVEPGITEEWRLENAEIANSIYSHIILTSSEIIVYNPKNFGKTPNATMLMALSPCSVMGFSELYLEQEAEIKTKQILTEIQVLKMIESNRCDFSVFPEDVAKLQLNKFGLAMTDSVAVFELKLRFTDKHKILLPLINKAIEKLVNTGAMNEIILKYRGLNVEKIG